MWIFRSLGLPGTVFASVLEPQVQNQNWSKVKKNKSLGEEQTYSLIKVHQLMFGQLTREELACFTG